MQNDYLTEEERRSIGMVLYFGGKDYGWEPYKEVKHFVLTNPEAIKDFSVVPFAANFRGTGHYEWEIFISMWLIQAARKAVEENTECDVSRVFNTEHLARPKTEGADYRRFTPEMVRKHIERFFTIEEETDSLCRLSANV